MAVLGNFVNPRTGSDPKYYDGKVPAAGTLTETDRLALAEISAIKAEVEKSISQYRFREALKYAMDLARLATNTGRCRPWKVVKTDPARVETIMNVCLQITANLTIIFAPFLPFSMDKLRIFLNMDELNWSNLGRTNLLPAGHQTNTPELLFEKIEDEVIEKQVNKLLATKRPTKLPMHKLLRPKKTARSTISIRWISAPEPFWKPSAYQKPKSF